MTFREISTRMLRSNYKRYLLYFYCNVFTIVVFNTFSMIYTNDDFMNPSLVNPLISSNIVAPWVFTVIFMFLFIPYSYGAFFRKRKSEYGVLMTLGMTEKEVLTNMLSENLTVSLLSLIAGMAAGTLLSLLVFGVIRNVIGITAVAWRLSLKPYAITAGVYLAIVAVTLALQLLGFLKTQITDMLKAKSRGEKEVKTSPFLLIAGCLLSIASVVFMMKWYRLEPWVLLISFGLMLAGVWLLIGCMRSILTGRPGAIDAGRSFVLQHFRSYRMVTFIAVSLFGIGVFLAGLSIVTYHNLLNNAISYSPYDLVYVQAGGKNEMAPVDASELLSKYGVSVTSSEEVPYMRNGAFNLFSASEVNRLTGSDYIVKSGEYLVIYQYDLNDGYGHELDVSGTRSFDLRTGTLQLEYAGQDVRILFNNNHGFADKTLLLNDVDYKTIEEVEKRNGYYSGVIKCFTFSDWRNSGQGLQVLQQSLSDQTSFVDASQKAYFKISSKLEAYETAQQSARFLIFVISLVVVLFYLSANVIIYFKIQGEAEEEKYMYRGLYRIGISGEEMRGILKRKNKLYCLIPLYTGSAVGVFFCFATSSLNGYGPSGIAFAAAVSAFLLLLQGLILICFTRCEEKILGVKKELRAY